ncbi:restriction endonuclease subunit S [Halanaerobium kushneri]|uniref:Type I restriction enzyme, S subunit n=1 Tax=Halanaerobium kushneri TaxID=56779 RepID=A0A1N6SMP1_9FIRM|nr:restriction endonuclease subunit S [Halanaerobium kushneri]SIQ42282.1 type I restriction enzyme, S subunit [Halanaerobium kushneri]
MSIYLDEFETLYGISDNIEKLRKKILDFALEGKLSYQSEEEKSGEDIIEKIAKLKEDLLSKGLVKTPRGKLKKISKEDIPSFEIPENWEWTRLGSLGETKTGKTPKRSNDEYYFGNIPFIKPDNIYYNKIDYNTKLKLTEEGAEKSRLVPENTILMVCIGTVGKAYITDRESCFNQQINSLTLYSDKLLEPKLFLYFMQSSYFNNRALELSSKTTIPIINKTKWKNILVPVPPLEEQKRIVEKIEKLMKEVDKLEDKLNQKESISQNLSESIVIAIKDSKNAEELKDNINFIIENFDVIFKTSESMDEMRNIVLQLAIEGKLVPQDESDEPALELINKIEEEKKELIKKGEIKKSRLKIEEKNNNKTHYIIPKNWKWEKLGNICFKITDGSHNPPKGISGEGYEMLSATNILNDKIDFKKPSRIIKEKDFKKEHKRTQIEKGDLLLTIVGTLGRSLVVDTDKLFTVQRSVAVLKTGINVHYLRYVMLSPYIKQTMEEEAKGTAQKGIYLGQLANLLIPIPSLSEQERIVKTVDALMEMIDKLKRKLEKRDYIIERLGTI